MNEALLSALKKRFPAHADAIPALLPALEAGEPSAFVLRYRRDLLGDLDDAAFRRIRIGFREERELQKRRGATARALQEAGNTDRALLRRVEQTRDLALLEDLIRPIRESRRGGEKRGEDPMTPVARWVVSGEKGVPEVPKPAPAAPATEPAPADESPAPDGELTSAAELPADETAATEPDAPAAPEAPAEDAPATEEPAEEAPAPDASEPSEADAEASTDEAPAAEAPEADAPAAETPAEDAVTEAVPAAESAAPETPEAPAEPAAEPAEGAPAAEAEPVAASEAAPDTSAESAESEAPAAVPAADGPVTLESVLAPYCGADGAHPTVADQTERLQHLVADLIGADAIHRQTVRNVMRRKGLLKTSAPTGKEPKPQYAPAIGLSEPITKVKPRTLLLVRRGQKAGVLHAHVQLEDADLKDLIEGPLAVPADHPHADLVRGAVLDALARVLLPAASIEVINERKRVAERSLIPTFAETLRERLLAPPAGRVPIVAVAPGSTGTARLLILDADGRPGRTEAVHPLPPRNEVEESASMLRDLVAEAGAKLVAVPASGRHQALREWVVTTLEAASELGAVSVPVHEAAASAFAGSEAGKSECPELPASARAALSLGRYVQDPMAEIVRYDVTRLVLGPNQRDVDQGELRRVLQETLKECAGHVGVDVNIARAELLAATPGLDLAAGRAIVAKRDRDGPFPTLNALRATEGLSEEAWQRSSGFLRLRGGDDPLDATQAHPTGADIARAVCEKMGRTVPELQGAIGELKRLDPAEFAGEAHTPADVVSILKAISYGAADPRGVFVPPASNPGIRRLRDVQEGMELEGVIASLAKFGAFVDIGIHQQGLVHVSELSHTFIDEPSQAASVGDRVRVKVLGVDAGKRRLSLSVKALLPPPPRVESERGGRRAGGRGRGGPGGPGGPGGRGGRGGGRRSNVPKPRDIPREADPFHLQLNALRAQLGMPVAEPAKPAEPKPKRTKRTRPPKPVESAPAAEETPEAAPAPVSTEAPAETPAETPAEAVTPEETGVPAEPAAPAESVAAEAADTSEAAGTPDEAPAPAEPESAPAEAAAEEAPADTSGEPSGETAGETAEETSGEAPAAETGTPASEEPAADAERPKG